MSGTFLPLCSQSGTVLTEEYENQEGRRVWLDRGEVQSLVEEMDTPRQRAALRLGAECGLRSHEICGVKPEHLFSDDVAGPMLEVPHGKGDKARETVVPESLRDVILALGHGSADERVIGVSERTIRNWVAKGREELRDDDERWQYVTSHDLRRSWAGALANADVDETVALRMGGWADLETFLDHYRGSATPKALRREREKVEWL